MTEIWKDIPGYEGLYQASNLGNIRSIAFINNRGVKHRIKVKAQKEGVWGRMYTMLYKDTKRKNWLVHRLIAITFLPNPNNYPEINHIDGNPKNNRVDNLEWCTASYNMKHAYKNGLNPVIKEHNEKAKKPIIRNDGKYYDCAYRAAEDLGVSVFAIRDVLKGRTTNSKGYTFSYVEREWSRAGSM